jgi:CRP/FNR family transcriptional regulator, anaerobic regulatory protein
LHTARAAHLNCGDCPIQHRAVCAYSNTDELAQLETIKYYRNFSAGQPIAFAVDTPDFVASVVTGIATLTQTLKDGRRQMVGILLPSDFLGRPGRHTASYDVTANTDVVLCCFRKKPFEDILANTPHISQRLLEMTLDELDAAREWMLVLGRKTAREKIASLLIIFARRTVGLKLTSVTRDITLNLSLTREEMADYLGLTLETVSRQMSALKKDGLILLGAHRKVTISNILRLLDEAGDDADGGIPH